MMKTTSMRVEDTAYMCGLEGTLSEIRQILADAERKYGPDMRVCIDLDGMTLVKYFRDETERERHRREKRQDANRRAAVTRRAKKEAEEKALLARLQAKWGDKKAL